MGGVGTSILGNLDTYRDRRASHHPTSDHTLNCEEPVMVNWAIGMSHLRR